MGFCRIDVCFVSSDLGGEKFHFEGKGLCGALVPWYGWMRVIDCSEDGGCRYFASFGVIAAVRGKDKRGFVVLKEKVCVV